MAEWGVWIVEICMTFSIDVNEGETSRRWKRKGWDCIVYIVCMKGGLAWFIMVDILVGNVFEFSYTIVAVMYFKSSGSLPSFQTPDIYYYTIQWRYGKIMVYVESMCPWRGHCEVDLGRLDCFWRDSVPIHNGLSETVWSEMKELSTGYFKQVWFFQSVFSRLKGINAENVYLARIILFTVLPRLLNMNYKFV